MRTFKDRFRTKNYNLYIVVPPIYDYKENRTKGIVDGGGEEEDDG
jgi:hypothetical protein